MWDSFADYVADLDRRTFFQDGVDTSDLVDVTCVGDYWRKFINIKTGKIVDCADFAKLATKEVL